MDWLIPTNAIFGPKMHLESGEFIHVGRLSILYSQTLVVFL